MKPTSKKKQLEEELTEKQKVFCDYYLVSYNATEAARKAGYKSPNANATALLNSVAVRNYLRQCQTELKSKLGIQQEEVLKQLYFLCTRDALDFVDMETGLLQTDIRKMSERARAVIDGFEQETWVDGMTGERHIKLKLKLSPKTPNIDLAMKHKGLFAPNKDEVTHKVDFSSLYGMPPNALAPDVIEDLDNPMGVPNGTLITQKIVEEK